MKTKTVFFFFCLSYVISACSQWRTNEITPTNAPDYKYFALLNTDTVYADFDETSVDFLWKKKNHSLSTEYRSDNLYRFFIYDGRKKIGLLDIDGSSADETLQEYLIFSVWFNGKAPFPDLRRKSLTFHRIK